MAIPNVATCLGNAAAALKKAGERERSPGNVRAYAALSEAWCYLAQTQMLVGANDDFNPEDAATWRAMPLEAPLCAHKQCGRRVHWAVTSEGDGWQHVDGNDDHPAWPES